MHFDVSRRYMRVIIRREQEILPARHVIVSLEIDVGDRRLPRVEQRPVEA